MNVTLDTEKAQKVRDVTGNVLTSCSRLFKQMSDAVVGTVADMYSQDNTDKLDDPDHSIRVLLKENRHMYIALTVILVLTLYTLFFRS